MVQQNIKIQCEGCKDDGTDQNMWPIPSQL